MYNIRASKSNGRKIMLLKKQWDFFKTNGIFKKSMQAD